MFWSKRNPSRLALELADSMNHEGWKIGAAGASHVSGISISAYSRLSLTVDLGGQAVRSIELSNADRRVIWQALSAAMDRTLRAKLAAEPDAA